MTESGGTGSAAGGGNNPADARPAGGSYEAGGETPPPAMPEESTLTPAPEEDAGSLVPDQLHDAPAYIPPPVGMTSGGIFPPPNPADVPSSAWITTAPQTAQRQRTGSRIGAIIAAIVVVIIVGAVVANFLGLLPNDKGKVLFGTAAGSDLCSVANQSTTIKTTDPVFFAAVLKHHMDGNQAITFKVTKDGQDLVNHVEPADGTSFDCYGNKDSLGTLDAGTYVFTVIHNSDIEATGTLTVQ